MDYKQQYAELTEALKEHRKPRCVTCENRDRSMCRLYDAYIQDFLYEPNDCEGYAREIPF